MEVGRSNFLNLRIGLITNLFLEEGGFNYGKEDYKNDALVGLFLFSLYTYLDNPTGAGEGEKGNPHWCKSSH
jgi:hypothetical protein